LDIKPRLDRESSERPKMTHRVRVLCVAIPLSALIVLGATLLLPIAFDHDLFDASDSAPAIGMAYDPHLPIILANNIAFTGNNSTTGISWGSGTEEDPYVITGLEIDAGGYLSAIDIGNSNVYFKVTNCLLYNATDQDIMIRFASNGSLIDNYCNDSKVGIKVWQSDNQSISWNTCAGNSLQGVLVSWSENVTVFNNTCDSNDDSGIGIYYSKNNSVSENLCYNNTYGILFSNSRRNEVMYNNLSSNSDVGVSIDLNSRDNRLLNNTFYHNNGTGNSYNPSNSQAFDAGIHNLWNTSGLSNDSGNFWIDMTSPDLVEPFGVVDNPYNISGGKGVKDYFPLTTMPTPPMIPEPAIVTLAPIMATVFIVFRRISGKKGFRRERKETS